MLVFFSKIKAITGINDINKEITKKEVEMAGSCFTNGQYKTHKDSIRLETKGAKEEGVTKRHIHTYIHT